MIYIHCSDLATASREWVAIGDGRRVRARARPHGRALPAILAVAGLTLAGCAGIRGADGGATGGVVDVSGPIPIPAGRAHATFQGGRLTGGANRLETYCELEIQTVSEGPQEAVPGRYRVTGERYTLLRDPTTRIPALIGSLSCSDAWYQESFWRLSGDSKGASSGARAGNLHSLRCIRPGFHCQLPPPLGFAEVPAVTGPALSVLPREPLAVPR